MYFIQLEVNVPLHASVSICVFDVLEMLRMQELVVLQGYGSRFAIDMECKRNFEEVVDGYDSGAG